MKIVEIFNSIEGEGIRQGSLVNFIRLAGCNLNCSYCDTTYANEKNTQYQELTVSDIKEILKKEEHSSTNFITITGGEPLIQEEAYSLIDSLVDDGYKVNIETNGSIDISSIVTKCLVTMDFKVKTSNMSDRMKLDNLKLLKENDVLKIVCKENDFQQIEDLLTYYNDDIKSYIYLSPIFGQIDLQKLVGFQKYLSKKLSNIEDKLRIQVQLHKIIWEPNKRGV